MNSLVGYGLSSDSESEGDGDDGNNSGTVKSLSEVGDGGTAVNKSRNFLLECGSGSGSESEPEEVDREPPPPPPPTAKAVATPSGPSRTPLPTPPLSSLNPNKLPPPPLGACSGSSVFANPFKAQADQKLNALQKHVPLTLQAKPSQIGGKRMCVSYRKDGRCRFGIKCKFAHDSDLQTSVIPSDYVPPVGDATPELDQRDSHTGASYAGGHKSFPQVGEEGETEGQQGKKRRVGLSNTLVPPKRAMKQYAMQRDRERLNMS